MTTLTIGGHPVYFFTPRYIDYVLPWCRYKVTAPLLGERQMNVSRIFLNCFGESRAVPMTAWGDLQNCYPAEVAKVVAEFGLHRVRKEFIAAVEWEFVF